MPQNNITLHPVNDLGYNFIEENDVPEGKDEYYLRLKQSPLNTVFRNLTSAEIALLIQNQNYASDWSKIEVAENFNPSLIQNSKFYGWVRIAEMDAVYLSFSNLNLPVGIYNSTITSCDIGKNTSLHNVSLLAHYILDEQVILFNVKDMLCTNHSKFGNGIIKKDEAEAIRIEIELCNENGKRAVLPFDGMLAADAYLWSQYRADKKLLEKFRTFTDNYLYKEKGYYGYVGKRTVIKNTGIIKDVLIGSDAYIKGANKLKNLTINSGLEGKTQIGEGCEIVNGIIGYGCRIFYGVKAVRFVMADHSQLKYGARLLNSFLGYNATISCCEVLNSLIFPAHEQHHNNSFLCAALVKGQSNIAAGATLGSNHNSRAADGEMVAGRGFWPGLCVSLKHNSVFAAYTILAKADYNYELYIPIPFCLVSNDYAKDELQIIPGYWFFYNMYALERNVQKYLDRDKRKTKKEAIEYHYLAPDTINEIYNSLAIMEVIAGENYQKSLDKNYENDLENRAIGKTLLQNKERPEMNFYAKGFENSRRKVVIKKLPEAYDLFVQLIEYYGVLGLISWIEEEQIDNFETLKTSLQDLNFKKENWQNLGGILTPDSFVKQWIEAIKSAKINGWNALHEAYTAYSVEYQRHKNIHAITILFEIKNWEKNQFSITDFKVILNNAIRFKKWLLEKIIDSRKKDYDNEFRLNPYQSLEEMEAVLGKMEDNSFVLQEQENLVVFSKKIENILSVIK